MLFPVIPVLGKQGGLSVCYSPFHCWAEKRASHHPFHCWAVKETSLSPVSLLGSKKRPPSLSRFTVGQQKRPLLSFPFHCWAGKEAILASQDHRFRVRKACSSLPGPGI